MNKRMKAKTLDEMADSIIIVRQAVMELLDSELEDTAVISSMILGKKLCKVMKALGLAHEHVMNLRGTR